MEYINKSRKLINSSFDKENIIFLFSSLIMMYWFNSTILILENLFLFRTYIGLIHSDNFMQNNENALLYLSIVMFFRIVGIFSLFINSFLFTYCLNCFELFLFYSLYSNGTFCKKFRETMVVWFQRNRYINKMIDSYSSSFLNKYFLQAEDKTKNAYIFINQKTKFIQNQNFYKIMTNIDIKPATKLLNNVYSFISAKINKNNTNIQSTNLMNNQLSNEIYMN